MSDIKSDLNLGNEESKHEESEQKESKEKDENKVYEAIALSWGG